MRQASTKSAMEQCQAGQKNGRQIPAGCWAFLVGFLLTAQFMISTSDISAAGKAQDFSMAVTEDSSLSGTRNHQSASPTTPSSRRMTGSSSSYRGSKSPIEQVSKEIDDTSNEQGGYSKNIPEIVQKATERRNRLIEECRAANNQQPQRQLQTNNTYSNITADNVCMMNKVTHTSQFGIGHRLNKMTSAFHMAQMIGTPSFQPIWKDCPDEANHTLFEFLFGNESLVVPPPLKLNGEPWEQQWHNNTVNVLNDCHLYGAARSQQEYFANLSSSLFTTDATQSIYWSKIESDRLFFWQLDHRFRGNQRIDDFWQEHQLEKHTLIGVHLRLGNGEGAHFVEAGRGTGNETAFIENTVSLLEKMVQAQPEVYTQKPPIIFLATDSAYAIDMVSRATKIPVITMPQTRLAKGEGVTVFAKHETGKCTQSWENMLLDMLVLGRSKVLVAPLRSSFTQTLPASMVLNRQGGQFCQSAGEAHYMTCFHSMEAWLFRFKTSHMTNYYVDSGEGQKKEYVYHKIITELPSPSMLEEKDFLDLKSRVTVLQPVESRKWQYGTRFDSTFRNFEPANPTTSWRLDDGTISQ